MYTRFWFWLGMFPDVPDVLTFRSQLNSLVQPKTVVFSMISFVSNVKKKKQSGRDFFD